MKGDKKVFKILGTVFAISVLIHAAIIMYKCSGEENTKQKETQPLPTPTFSVPELDKTIPTLLKKAGIPGMSIAIINDSKVVYSRALGVKNVETNEPVTETTLFEAASLTKPVLAYTALKLVDDGKLDLDKPLYLYMEYPDAQHDERYKLITARIVLKHASGFPNWRWQNKDKKLDITFTPGEKFSYSGEGYVFLQRVMEKITGKGLEDIMKEKVFVPLKMTNSSLLLADAAKSAAGHTQDSEVRKKRLSPKANGAASLHTTANDYAKFLIAVANGDGLSAHSWEEMLRPQIPASEENAGMFWGLGLGLQKTTDDIYFWHWGDNYIFKAYTVISKSKKTGIIYFTNSFNGLSIIRKMVEITMNGTFPVNTEMKYPEYDGPYPVIRKLIETEGTEAGIKKYREWKAAEPGKFKERMLNEMGYYFLGKKMNAEAIDVFKLNVEAYPDSANVYDSLGEAYMKNGNKESAIKNYEKSVRLNPDNKSGIDALKKLKRKGKRQGVRGKG